MKKDMKKNGLFKKLQWAIVYGACMLVMFACAFGGAAMVTK